MKDVQDTLLYARHEELLDTEEYLKNTLAEHRANAAYIIGGSRGGLVQHRITCDTLAHKLSETQRELEFTERLIAARFTAGKLDLRHADADENLNVGKH